MRRQQMNLSKFYIFIVIVPFASIAFALMPTKKAEAEEMGILPTISRIETTLTPAQFTELGGIGGIDNLSNMIGGQLGGIGNLIGGGIGNITGLFQSFMMPFIGYLNNFFAMFKGMFGNILNGVMGQINGAIGGVLNGVENQVWGELGQLGGLNLPDIPASQQKNNADIAGGVTQGSAAEPHQQFDRFNVNPQVLAYSVSANHERNSAKALSASLLSGEGQNFIKTQMTTTTQLLQQIGQKGQEAQSMDVTQDVMKNLTAMQAGQATLTANIDQDLLGLRVQEAASGVVLANISEAVDEKNRADHAKTMAGADQVLRKASGLYIPGNRPTTNP